MSINSYYILQWINYSPKHELRDCTAQNSIPFNHSYLLVEHSNYFGNKN